MSDELLESTETIERAKELLTAFEEGTASDAEFEALRDLLAVESPRDRAAVLYGIGSVGIVDDERTEQAVDVLLWHCFDQPGQVREAAAESLSDLARERTTAAIRPAIDTVQERLGDEDERVREAATFVLTELSMEHPELMIPLVDDLRACLDDNSRRVRKRTLGVLGGIAGERPAAFEPPFDDLRACLDDDVPQVRSRAVSRLGAITKAQPEGGRPAIDDFRACLADESWRVRSSAVSALASLAETQPETVRPVIDDILALLSPPAEFVSSCPGGEQIHITQAFGRLGVTYPHEAPRIVETLQSILDEEGAGNIAFGPIYECLTRELETIATAHPAVVVPAIEDLVTGLDASRTGRRRDAARALTAIGRAHPDEVRPAVETLQERLEDEDAWVRMAATEALLAIDAVDPKTVTEAEEICALLLADDESAEAIERFEAAEPAVGALVVTDLRSRVGDMDSVDQQPAVAAAFRTISSLDDAYRSFG